MLSQLRRIHWLNVSRDHLSPQFKLKLHHRREYCTVIAFQPAYLFQTAQPVEEQYYYKFHCTLTFAQAPPPPQPHPTSSEKYTPVITQTANNLRSLVVN